MTHQSYSHKKANMLSAYWLFCYATILS